MFRTIKLSAAIALGLATFAQPALAEDGERAFKSVCGACHSNNKVHRVGPSLVGVVGRQAGTAEGFEYSDAMKKVTVTWDRAELDKFLAEPKSVVPGTNMTFPGLKDEAKRQLILDYLAGLGA